MKVELKYAAIELINTTIEEGFWTIKISLIEV